MVDGTGRTIDERALTPVEYAGWVDWIEPISREPMGRARQAGEARQGSPRFAEMVVNTPKSLSIAAALHPDVSEALDAAQRDAVAEIRCWLGRHSVTRIGPRGRHGHGLRLGVRSGRRVFRGGAGCREASGGAIEPARCTQ